MGLFGVYGVKQASSVIYYGLHMLQHRGQEGAGIVTFDDEGKGHRFRAPGLVSEIINNKTLADLEGSIGVGSVSYVSIAKSSLTSIQPLFFHHSTGDFSIASEGNLINAHEIQAYLERTGSLFQTATDAELLAHLVKKGNAEDPRIFSLIEALNMMDGGFTFLVMTKNRIYAARDKYGIKPLCIGTLGDGYVISSETCAFDIIGAKFLRDVQPGEVVTIDHNGIRSRQYSKYQCHKMCAMEYIYFARPDSDIDGCNVHEYRKESGRRLYRECPADADIVIGVPDSSLSAAMGYAEESGIPYEIGLVKHKYVGRTFIQPVQNIRENSVKKKLSAIHSIVAGKRVVMVDDSIVRGTTSIKIIKILREAGAKEVHVRIASPRMTHPCFYGVDTSTFEELLCAHRGVEEACKYIGADSLGYLSPEAAIASCPGRTELCLACFTGKYPTSLYDYQEEIDKNK